MSERRKSHFEKVAEPAGGNFLSEFLAFVGHGKKWWLLPMLLVLLLFSVIMYLSTTAAAPFIYTLF